MRLARLRKNGLIALAGVLISCQASGPIPATPVPTLAAAEPTAGIVQVAAPQTPAPTQTLPPPSDALQDTAQLVLPSPGPAPKSAWRPPLYDVPWAINSHDHFFFTRPIAADEVNWPLPDYRYGGIFFASDIVHTGIDIDATQGTPVITAGPGKVVWTGYGLLTGSKNLDDPYGLAVAIRHDFGYNGQRLYTVYAHLSEILVQNGQRLETGETLGLVGNTGNTTGPHLHFEVRVGALDFFETYNPELWLSPPQGWGVLVGKVANHNGNFLAAKEVKVRAADSSEKWTVNTYGKFAVNPDPYYGENMVLSDLPAGRYIVEINYLGFLYDQVVEIHPGEVTYFGFYGRNGFDQELPPTPPFESIFTPAP